MVLERDKRFDNIKGLLIFLVVLGHILLSFNNGLRTSVIYFFHMPLFMIISGYFSKKSSSKTKIFRLLIYFVLMTISFSIYDYFTTGIFNPFIISYSSWYILLLFIYRIIYYYLHNCIDKYKYIIWFILLIFAIGIGFFKIDLFFLRMFEYLFFFHTGYIYSNKLVKKKNIAIAFLLISIVNLILVLSLSLSIDYYFGGSYEINTLCLVRLFQYFTNILLFASLVNLIPNKEIPLLTKFGRESLIIYLYHRIPILLLVNTVVFSNTHFIIYIIVALIVCLLFSFKVFHIIIDYIVNFIEKLWKKKLWFMIIAFGLLVLFLIIKNDYRPINNIGLREQKILDNSISIGFVGDLILLEDQINDSYNNGEYNFDYMFKYTKKLFDNTDYTIGVFEGPSDDDNDYSIGNYDDDKDLRLNYPKEFLTSIKNSGIDLVTLANNHIYDRGYNSAVKTIDSLNNSGLDYVGIFDKEINHKYRIVDVKGIKIGIVAYTYGTNYPNDTNEPDVITILDEKQKEMVINDIKYLKNNSDIVIVLPHYGTEFNYTFDEYQKKWNNIFLEAGADIIFGDHSHVIGEFTNKNDQVLLASPGNYVNSYIGHDSDLSMYAKVYIDKDTKKIVMTSVIPMLAIKKDQGYFPVPLFDLSEMNENTERVEEVKKIFGKIIMNNENIKVVQEYYKFDNKYFYSNNFELTENDKESIIYKTINNNQNICFIGDSITEGSFNNNHPWYEPITSFFSNKNIINISKSSYTTDDVIKSFSNIISESNCNVGIINIGTNDIRYNETDENKYINNINQIINLLPNSTIILISPWETYNGDKYMDGNINIKKELYSKYAMKLQEISDNKRIYYINPNDYIKSYMNNQSDYLVDGVHPNEILGIKLYSFATIRSN